MRACVPCTALVLALAGSCAVLVAAAAQGDDFDVLLNARSIHCEFYAAVRPADAIDSGADEPRPEVLIHYSGINRSRTRAWSLSTRSAGSREVAVVRTGKAVHFVDYTGGLYTVTTVFGCNQRSRRGGEAHCVSFGAANARHLDASVHWQPDAVFEHYRHLANHGFCDHGFVNVQKP